VKGEGEPKPEEPGDGQPESNAAKKIRLAKEREVKKALAEAKKAARAKEKAEKAELKRQELIALGMSAAELDAIAKERREVALAQTQVKRYNTLMLQATSIKTSLKTGDKIWMEFQVVGGSEHTCIAHHRDSEDCRSSPLKRCGAMLAVRPPRRGCSA
jgi:hypothetical protein